MDFIPLTQKDVADMLSMIGLQNLDDLFSHVPAKLNRPLDLPAGLSEMALKKNLQDLASKNKPLKLFRGAGSYAHYAPSLINHLLLRGEFYTAYTPYQAEISQGTLQAIYEFQTMLCRLTGMDVANASMYDASTALAEAVLLACGEKKRPTVYLANALHPNHTAVLRTYADAAEVSVLSDPKGASCIVVQNPSFFGELQDLSHWRKIADENDALLIVSVPEATSLALLSPPGLFADLVVGDVQGFGLPVGFGGPYAGFFTCKKELLRKMPGRLCGMTQDASGKKGFVLTLQAREQHIRREKATSNICTNQALMALSSLMWLSALGPKGIRDVALTSYRRAHDLQKKLEERGFSLAMQKPFYNEFLVTSPTPVSALNGRLEKIGFLGGLDVGGKWLLCATELLSEKDVEAFCDAL